MIRCAYPVLSKVSRLPQSCARLELAVSSIAHFSVSTQINRELLGLNPPSTNISKTGPQSASDHQVLKQSRSENRKLTHIIKKAANARNWKAAKKAFQEASPPDPVLYSVLLHAADRCDRAEEAFALYEQMCREEVPATGAHFVPLIRLAGRAGQLRQALSFKEELCKRGIAPDAFICAALVEAHRQAGDVSGALEVWRGMKESGVSMTPPLLSALMSTVGQSGDVAGTEALLQEATAYFVPNRIHLNCMLDACRHAGDASSALRIFSGYRANGIEPDVVTFTLLLAVLRRTGQARGQMESLLQQMKECGIVADKFFLEEHLSCVFDMDIQDFLLHGNTSVPHKCSRENLQIAAELLQQARAEGMQLSRMASQAEERISQVLQSSPAASAGGQSEEWVRVLCSHQTSTAVGHSEYFWDRASGRTQWEKPLGPIMDTVQAAPVG